MVLSQYLSFHKAQHTFSLYTNIPWDQTSKLYSGRTSCYMLLKYEEELFFKKYQEGFLNTYAQNIIWYSTNYVRKSNVFN